MTATMLREEQHTSALRYANEIRLARSRFKRSAPSIADREAAALYVACAFDRRETETMNVLALLRSIKRVGDVYAAEFCRKAAVRPGLLIRDLTPRQRLTLIAALNRGWSYLDNAA